MCSDLKKLRGIKKIILIAPWDEYYLNKCKLPPNFDHKNLLTKPLYDFN